MKFYKMIEDYSGRSEDGTPIILYDKPTPSCDRINYDNLFNKKNIEKVDCLYLVEPNKLQDIMLSHNLNSFGIIINNKVKNIFLKFKLHKIEIIPIQFVNFPDIDDYYFMFFYGNLTNIIDYKKTKFAFCHYMPIPNYNNKIEYLNINNKKEMILYDKKASTEPFIQFGAVDTIHFKNKFYYDIFKIGYFDEIFYFSEKVIELLIKEKINGIEKYLEFLVTKEIPTDYLEYINGYCRSELYKKDK